jgi:hypothetical protein
LQGSLVSVIQSTFCGKGFCIIGLSVPRPVLKTTRIHVTVWREDLLWPIGRNQFNVFTENSRSHSSPGYRSGRTLK